jgi:hypothetical protein
MQQERSMKRIHAVLLIVGGSWLAVVLWVVLSNVILRETHLGIIASILDKLPPAVGVPLFVLFWAVFLIGWAVLVGFGLRPMLRTRIVGLAKHQD